MYDLMIADDEQLERAALRQIVDKNMPELRVVGEARNGDEAVELAREFLPDIILMDIKMPGRTGLEAAREILQLNPETKTIILTAFDYFEYAQTALHIGTHDYLLKPVRPKELLKVLKNCVDDLDKKSRLMEEAQKYKSQLANLWPYIEASFVYDLFNGNITGEEEMKQRAGILGVNLLPSTVMTIGIEGNEVGCQSLTEFERQLNKQKVFEILKNVFKDHPSILITPIMAEKFAVLVPCVNTNAVEYHYEFCRAKGEFIIHKLAENDISISIGIGKYYEDILMIRQSYLESQAAQRCSSFAGGGEIVTCLSCRQTNSVTDFREYQYNKESELVDLICAGNWEKAAQVLDFLWNNIRTSNIGEELQKACSLELLVVLYRAAISSESETQSMAVLNLNNVGKIMESNTIDQLGECFYAAVNEIMESIKTGNEDITASIVQMSKNFINNNFSQPITLEDVARHVHMSPCYLSRIFSKEAGMPFKKYLTNTKLAYARKLLLSTSKPIGEIAYQVGYQDNSYFCRIFKQHEGLSPNEYRMIYTAKIDLG